MTDDCQVSLLPALPSHHLNSLAESWLAEDCPHFDPAAVAVGTARRTATLYAKSPLVLAGTPFFNAIFSKLDCTVQWFVKDGKSVEDASSENKVTLAWVTGPACGLLQGERVALNALSECSSLATAGRAAVEKVQAANWKGVVAGTRKTAPGLRLLQKFAMILGGMDPHRHDLSSMVMIKDNHIRASGSISKAVSVVRKVSGFSMKIDVEAETECEALEACKSGADVVMLDNFRLSDLERVSEAIKNKWPHILVEASGSVTPDSILNYCLPSVDIISLSINKYITPVDISLKIDKE